MMANEHRYWWNICCGFYFDEGEQCPGCHFQGSFTKKFLANEVVPQEKIWTKYMFRFFPGPDHASENNYATSPEHRAEQNGQLT